MLTNAAPAAAAYVRDATEYTRALQGEHLRVEAEARQLELLVFEQNLEIQKLRNEVELKEGAAKAARKEAGEARAAAERMAGEGDRERRAVRTQVGGLERALENERAEKEALESEVKALQAALGRWEAETERIMVQNRELSAATVQLSDTVLVEKEAELASLRTANRELKDRMSKAEAETAGLAEANNVLKSALAKTQDSMAEAHNEFSSSRANIAQLKADLEEARVLLVHADNEKATLLEELREKSRAHAEAVRERTRIRNSLGNTEEEMRRMSTQVEALREQVLTAQMDDAATGKTKDQVIGELRAALEESQALVEAKDADLAKMVKLESEYAGELSEAVRRATDLEAELQDAETSRNALEEAIGKYEEELSLVEAQVKTLEGEVSASHEREAAAAAAKEDVVRAKEASQRAVLEEKNAELEAVLAENDSLRAANEEFKVQILQSAQVISDRDAQMEELHAAIQSKDAELDDRLGAERAISSEFKYVKEALMIQERDAASLRASLDAAEQLETSLRNEIELRKNELSDALDQIESLEARLGAREDDVVALKRVNSKAQEVINGLEAATAFKDSATESVHSQLEAALAEIRTLQSERKSLAAALAEVRDRGGAAEAQTSRAQAQNQSLRVQLEMVEKENTMLKADLSALQRSYEEVQSEMRRLLDQVKLMDLQMKSRLEREQREEEAARMLQASASQEDLVVKESSVSELASRLRSQLDDLMNESLVASSSSTASSPVRHSPVRNPVPQRGPSPDSASKEARVRALQRELDATRQLMAERASHVS